MEHFRGLNLGLLEPLVIAGGLLLVLALLCRFLRSLGRLLTGRSPPGGGKLAGGVLGTVLMAWSKHDHLTLKDLLDGGIVIFGRPGSGKSSSSSYQLLKSVVAYEPSGGLILSASSGDRALIDRVSQVRRLHDCLLAIESLILRQHGR